MVFLVDVVTAIIQFTLRQFPFYTLKGIYFWNVQLVKLAVLESFLPRNMPVGDC